MTSLLASFPWHDILMPKPSWAEKVFRPAVVYLILLVFFRFASRREIGQSTLFDILIMLIISNVVQNAMIGDDNSVLGASAGALTVIVLSGVLSRVTAKSRQARYVLEGKTVLLVRDGKIIEANMKSQAVSHNDLASAIRAQGLARMADVAFAILELDGSISVIKQEEMKDSRPPDCLPYEIVGDLSVADADCKEDSPTAAA